MICWFEYLKTKSTRLLFCMLVFTILLLGTTGCAEDTITRISSFQEIDFSQFQQGDLVVFDADETLIQTVDSFLINEHTPQGKAYRLKMITSHPEVKDWNRLISTILVEAERTLIEPAVIPEINALQSRGVPTIMCTAMNTGPIGHLESMESWRYAHLKELGFEGSYSDQIIPLSDKKKKPVFYRGIIATDLLDKGPSLIAFLEAMHLRPKRVFMVDDMVECLQSVRNSMSQIGIEFHGYEYTGSCKSPWQPELYDLQASHLVQTRHWLPDEEALKKLNK